MVSTPGLWINALGFSPRTNEASVHISKLMAKLVELKADTLDLEKLYALTRGDFMPKVDPESALAMCELEDLLEGNHSTPQKQLSSLQERCADSLSRTWQSLVALDAANLELLLKQKPFFLVELLIKSSTEAQNALSAAQAELEKSKPMTWSRRTFE